MELTAEEQVTNLLASNQIINKLEADFCIENECSNLGDFLQKAPKIDILETMNIKKVKPSDNRFTFINTQWRI